MTEIIIFGLENNEGYFWRKAFRPYGSPHITFVEVDDRNDIGSSIGGFGPKEDLFVVSKTVGEWNPDGAIWRWGAVKPNWIHEPFLLLLKRYQESEGYSFPMLSNPSFHLICENRLRMLSALSSDKKIPIVPHFAFVTGRALIESKWKPEFPCIVKFGSFHQGLCKMMVSNEDQWSDALSFVFPLKMTIVIEKYVKFNKDLRVLWIGDEMWTMVREFVGWKANRMTKLYVEETTEEQWALTERCRKAVGGAEYGALDLVERDEGELVVFEINDCPQLDPEVIMIKNSYEKMANLLMNQIKK